MRTTRKGAPLIGGDIYIYITWVYYMVLQLVYCFTQLHVAGKKKVDYCFWVVFPFSSYLGSSEVGPQGGICVWL